MSTVTSITRHRPAKPVTTAEVVDACDAAIAAHKTLSHDLAELLLSRTRHVINLTTIAAPPVPKPLWDIES